MKMIRSKSIKKPIVLLQMLGDGNLLIVDNETTVRFLEIENLSLLDGFKVNVKHLRYSTSVVAFSKDVEFFALITADSKETKLYNVNTKKCLATVDRHHGEVSCVGIDPLSRYVFSCGDDGKTFAIDTKTAKLAFTLPVHVDTVNDIAFSENGNWVATASYDRKISLFSLVTMSAKDKFKGHSSPVMKLHFLKQNRLLSIDKKSSAIIWDIYTGKVIKRLEGVHDDVASIASSDDGQFLFIGTKLGYIILYDANTYEQLSSKFIKVTSPITQITFDAEHNHLIISTEDGFLMFFDIYEGIDTLKTMLQNKQFSKIQEAVDFNPILAYTELYELMKNFWIKTLEKAKIFLQNGDQKKALLLLDNFKHIPSKNTIIQKLLRDFAEFEKFTLYAKQGKLALAYGLAKSFPIYRESKIFKSLEARWKKTFAQAQKHILQPREKEKAKDILAPYRGITEKTKLIQELLTQGEVYKRFRDAIGQKSFKICFELIKKYPFLKEFPEYDVLISYGDNLYIKSQQLVISGESFASIKILRILTDFEDFKDEATELLDDIASKQKFYNAIRDEDIVTAYNMMAQSDALLETSDGINLQNQWNDDVNIANGFAVNGDALATKDALKKYIIISSKSIAIATIFSLCYMIQLEDGVAKKIPQYEMENGIKNYMLNFGDLEQVESFIGLFLEQYPDSKLNPELLTKGGMSMWKPSMITNSILE